MLSIATNPLKPKAPPPKKAPPVRDLSQRGGLTVNGMYMGYDPIAAGVITRDEVLALKTHEAQVQASWREVNPKPLAGAADFIALHVKATLNYSWPIGSHIRRDSIRYWWLVAFYDLQWAERRADKALMPHEQAAKALSDMAYAMSNALQPYYEWSRRGHQNALKRGDINAATEIAGRIRSSDDYTQRRKILLAGRKAHSAALRKLLPLIAEYRRQRSILDGEVR